MTILDKNNLLSAEEHKAYERLIKLYRHEPQEFLLEVREDQESIDMNDINYVIIVKVRATHLNHQKSQIYLSRANSGTWLTEFEEDLKDGEFC